MNKEYTEKDVWDTLNTFIDNKQFIDVRAFFKFAKMLIIISYKGTGKSYSAMKGCIDELKKGNEFVWVRNTEKEYINSKVSDSFRTILHETNLDTNYVVRNNGIYFVNNTQDKQDRGLLKALFNTMNKSLNSASQNALNKCTMIVYDEFINPEFRKATLFKDFITMSQTMMRKNPAQLVLLGNKHESNNDILTNLGVEFDWENEKHQILYRKEQELLVLYLGKYEIEKMNDANLLIEKWSMYSPSMKKFNSGGLFLNNMYAVKNWEMNNLAKVFKPKFRFDLNGIRYCVGEIEDEGETYLYIKQLDSNYEFEKETKRIYCYLAKDKKADNIFVYDIDDLDSVELLLRFYNKGKLYFSSAYGEGEFKLLLFLLKPIEQNR